MLCVNPVGCTYCTLDAYGEVKHLLKPNSQWEQYTLYDEYEEEAERMPVLQLGLTVLEYISHGTVVKNLPSNARQKFITIKPGALFLRPDSFCLPVERLEMDFSVSYSCTASLLFCF